jgi:hypothetical protein
MHFVIFRELKLADREQSIHIGIFVAMGRTLQLQWNPGFKLLRIKVFIQVQEAWQFVLTTQLNHPEERYIEEHVRYKLNVLLFNISSETFSPGCIAQGQRVFHIDF